MKAKNFTPRWLVVTFVALASVVSSAQQLPPSSYYTAVSNSTSTALKSALHDVIKGHTVIPYDASSLDTYDVLTVLDADSSNAANVILIYSGYSVPASTRPDWNREHIWPQSFGVDSGDPNSDLFNLHACDAGVNSSRNNKYFDVSTGSISAPAEAPESSYDGDSWEPRDADKGFVARACFYMATRYDGTGGDASLSLADVPNLGADTFAKLTTLLDWNRRFPPSDSERIRNALIYSNYQHNRNPFIDNPDFADMVFLGVDGFAAWQGTRFSTAERSNATVAASSADPDGDGLPNLAEYALGHDPHVADAAALQDFAMQAVNGTNYIYLTHHRHHYLSGVTLTYQISTNLTAWDDITAEVITNTQLDAVQDSVTVRLPAPGPSAFVRLKMRRLADVPFLVENGVTLIAESCSVANGAIDPGETVTMEFSLKNVGSVATSNLVVTLLATGGVTAPSGAQTYGVLAPAGAAVAQPFTFTASGTCGETVTATLQLQDGVTSFGTIAYLFLLGEPVNPLTENFDAVTAPALPAGWTTAASGAQSTWVSSTNSADSLPNVVFSPDPGAVGVNELNSPTFYVASGSARLTFQHHYSLAANTTNTSVGYDGGVLEISIGGGSFQDILDAGGSFASGAYNATLSGDYANPLAGRPSWSGDSLGYITTTVNLPAVAAGQNVQLRWRCAAGNAPGGDFTALSSSGTLAFWNFDASGATPTTVASNLSVTPMTVSNVGGSLTFFQGNPSTGQAIASSAFTTASGPPATNYSYFGFAVTVTNGYQVSLSSLSYDDRRSATGPSNSTVQVSRQSNFSSIIYDSGTQDTHTAFTATPMNTLTLTNTALTGTLYFRIYGYTAGGSAGTWRLDNLNLQGAIDPIPIAAGGWYIDSVSIDDTACCGSP